MYKKELPRVRPEEAGISSRLLLELLQELDGCGTEMHGLMIERHGKVILEGWWAPYDSATAHICHSMGKQFSGGHGQDVVMSRPNDLVISINQAAGDRASRAVNEIISKYLLKKDFSAGPVPEDEEGNRALCRYLDSLQIADREKCNMQENMDQWNGIFRVVKGAFHINTELRPVDDVNVYTDFYDHEDVDIKKVSIYDKGQMMELVFDDGTDRTRIMAYLDGKLRPVYSKGAIPIYTQTVSAARMTGRDLIVETKFLQTCFWTKLVFHHVKGCKYTVCVTKERLHEDKPYISMEAELEKWNQD